MSSDIGSCLLYGVGISIFSTGVYMILNDKKESREYGIICTIIFIVSILLLYITNNGKNSSIIKSTITDNLKNIEINNTPPF